MKVTLRLFAALRDRAGTDRVDLAVEGEPTVAELLAQLPQLAPALAAAAADARLLVAVNQELVQPAAARLRDGDEVALLPPFSGGSQAADRVLVQTADFSVDAELARIKRLGRGIGGIAVFVGAARDFARGRRVVALEYQHFAGMAERRLHDIARQAREKFDIIGLTLIHRVGPIGIGENIVLVIAAAAHREAAFAACRWCIDTLKTEVPIWKRERTPEGAVWVDDRP